MDNLTHTLLGLVVGETVARSTRGSSELNPDLRRTLFVTVMTIGSNVPDLDLIPSRILDSKLNYLLHHRGHTHTIVGAIVLSLLLYWLCALWCRWRKRPLARVDRLQLIGVGFVAATLHIALDATNSYGVHPFWPLDNRWYFGDAVFIVEPMFWAASAPLVFLLRTLWAKAFVAFALVAGVGLSVSTGMVPAALCGVLAALTLVMLAVGKFASARTALIVTIATWLVIDGGFAYASSVAADRTSALAAKTFPNETLNDHVLTPMPANPFCWSVILVQSSAERWTVRRASLALKPEWFTASECPSRGDPTQGTAPIESIDASNTNEVRWINEVSQQVTVLRDWVNKDCDAAAFMHFVRAPWLGRTSDGVVLGDLRFDNERGLSFAEFRLSEERSSCMWYVPRWTPPRMELLESRQ